MCQQNRCCVILSGGIKGVQYYYFDAFNFICMLFLETVLLLFFLYGKWIFFHLCYVRWWLTEIWMCLTTEIHIINMSILLYMIVLCDWFTLFDYLHDILVHVMWSKISKSIPLELCFSYGKWIFFPLFLHRICQNKKILHFHQQIKLTI